jgi:outer membrane protein assembly factor BamD
MYHHESVSRSARSRARKWILLAALLVWLPGCNFSVLEFYFGDLFATGKKPEKQPQQLAMEGVQKMQEKDYGDAIKAFQQLKERYPYSKYAILAELKLADAHFYKGQYADAAIAYEEFVRLHPRNEVIPYVLYQIGMCHFLSFSTIDRDQEETRLAMDAFRRVVQAFPQSEYSQKAQKQLFECEKRIVSHEFYVARFYYRLEKYSAAKERLDNLLANYSDAAKAMGLEQDSGNMLAACEREIAKGGPKESIWSRLGL